MSELTKMNLIAIVQQLPDEDIEFVQQYITILEDKLQQKENIIKEVREKTKENQEYLGNAKEMYINQNNEILKTHTLQLINNNLSQNDKLLEILEKGE